MLKAICTLLMKTRRCLVEMNLKLIAWTNGQTFDITRNNNNGIVRLTCPITRSKSHALSK